MPRMHTLTLHPFGRGNLTTTGAQYATAVTGITDTAQTVESVTVELPELFSTSEIEIGLTMALASSSTTDSMSYYGQISDDGTNWQALCAAQTATNETSYTDYTVTGYFLPATNYLGKQKKFRARMLAASGGTTDTVSAKAKNSSYLKITYIGY